MVAQVEMAFQHKIDYVPCHMCRNSDTSDSPVFADDLFQSQVKSLAN